MSNSTCDSVRGSDVTGKFFAQVLSASRTTFVRSSVVLPPVVFQFFSVTEKVHLITAITDDFTTTYIVKLHTFVRFVLFHEIIVYLVAYR